MTRAGRQRGERWAQRSSRDQAAETRPRQGAGSGQRRALRVLDPRGPEGLPGGFGPDVLGEHSARAPGARGGGTREDVEGSGRTPGSLSRRNKTGRLLEGELAGLSCYTWVGWHRALRGPTSVVANETL